MTLCGTFRNLNLYVEPLWNLEPIKNRTFVWNLAEPGARFPAAAPDHPEALLEEPQAFQAVGEKGGPSAAPYQVKAQTSYELRHALLRRQRYRINEMLLSHPKSCEAPSTARQILNTWEGKQKQKNLCVRLVHSMTTSSSKMFRLC